MVDLEWQLYPERLPLSPKCPHRRAVGTELLQGKGKLTDWNNDRCRVGLEIENRQKIKTRKLLFVLPLVENTSDHLREQLFLAFPSPLRHSVFY